jgi:hypothetical protein
MHASLTFETPARTGPGMWSRSKDRLKRMGASAVSAVLTPHKASLRRLAEMPLSVLGTAGVDFAAFQLNHDLGWLVIGVSLFIIEHMISDDVDDGQNGRRPR